MATAFTCTESEPWSKDKSTPAAHPDAIYLDDFDDSYNTYARYRCPHCNLTFDVELAG